VSDVVVIGGGPAGLSAALVLARGCMSVRLLDAGPARNESTVAMHGFIGHDGESPSAFRERGHRELRGYGVEIERRRAVSLEKRGDGLVIGLDDGQSLRAPKVLVTVGLIDRLPALPGLKEAWGKTAFSCPHCHGYELKGQHWGLLALQKSMARLAPTLTRWTTSLTLLANGRTDLEAETLAMLEKRSVQVEPRKLTGLRVEGSTIRAALFEDGEVPLDALLLHPPQRQSDLVLFAGLTLDAEGFVKIDDRHLTSMAGVYAAGDCTGSSARALEAANDAAYAAVAMLEI
jgi:thioredoxin reductase